MNLLSKPSTTSALLGIIAILLLVQVVQNSKRSPGPSFAPPPQGQMSNPHMMQPQGNEGFQQDAPGGMPTDSEGNFHPGNMIYAALVCPDDPTATLADSGCSGGEADARRKLVDDATNKGLPIPRVFDEIIKKYGEKALTAEAMNIRKMRRAGGARPPAPPAN